MTAIDEASVARRPFRHEALFYSTVEEFVAGTGSFIRAGLARGEAVLTVVDAPKVDRLRKALGEDAARVEFADMAEVGRNPALIIQAWRDFARARAPGQAIRGIGEPISAERSAAALTECHIHESLLNVAFEHDTDFWLLCPYDTTALPAPVLDHAAANHPFVRDHTGAGAGAGVAPAPAHDARAHDHGTSGTGFDWPLPEPAGRVASVAFDRATLGAMRAFVANEAARAGVADDRVADLVIAASEIATNAIVHGGRAGHARVWSEGDYFLSEIRGAGHIADPLIGRLRPEPGRSGGYGLWLTNQFCDLVQIRSSDDGTTTVRLHVRRR